MQDETSRPAGRQKPARFRIPPRFAEEMLGVLSDIMSVEHLDQVLRKIALTVADLFAIRTLVIGVLDENEQVYRVRAAHGYSPDREKKIKKVVYSRDKLMRDVSSGAKIVDNVYLIQPGPEAFLKSEEAFYNNIQDIEAPRTDPSVWHELDYLILMFADREGRVVGYIEIDEPVSKTVPDKDTIEAMEVFSRLAAVAIENARLYSKQVEVAQRSRYLGDIIAHDINNYNQAVTSYLQMALSAEGLPSKVATYLERASSSAWGISELIQRSNKLVQIEEEGAQNLGPVDLGEVLKQSVAEVLRDNADRDVTIDGKMGNHRHYVTANQLVEGIFTNILTNAVEYDPHDKVVVEVTVGELSAEDRRYWCVSIADRGIGIPDSKKNIVFGRFASDEARMPGSGLGLSIVRAIVEAYNGMVWAEDRVPGEPAQGSVIRVALPIAVSKR